jgi:hypothetical protein
MVLLHHPTMLCVWDCWTNWTTNVDVMQADHASLSHDKDFRPAPLPASPRVPLMTSSPDDFRPGPAGKANASMPQALTPGSPGQLMPDLCGSFSFVSEGMSSGTHSRSGAQGQAAVVSPAAQEAPLVRGVEVVHTWCAALTEPPVQPADFTRVGSVSSSVNSGGSEQPAVESSNGMEVSDANDNHNSSLHNGFKAGPVASQQQMGDSCSTAAVNRGAHMIDVDPTAVPGAPTSGRQPTCKPEVMNQHLAAAAELEMWVGVTQLWPEVTGTAEASAVAQRTAVGAFPAWQNQQRLQHQGLNGWRNSQLESLAGYYVTAQASLAANEVHEGVQGYLQQQQQHRQRRWHHKPHAIATRWTNTILKVLATPIKGSGRSHQWQQEPVVLTNPPAARTQEAKPQGSESIFSRSNSVTNLQDLTSTTAATEADDGLEAPVSGHPTGSTDATFGAAAAAPALNNTVSVESWGCSAQQSETYNTGSSSSSMQELQAGSFNRTSSCQVLCQPNYSEDSVSLASWGSYSESLGDEPDASSSLMDIDVNNVSFLGSNTEAAGYFASSQEQQQQP